MSFFETIRQRLGNKPLNYLWELKVTDAEYVELKQLLTKYAKSFSRNCNNRFITVSKECALFVAEYWRREYVAGKHDIKMVCNAIPITDEGIIAEFYKEAKRGVRILKLEIYQNKNGEKKNQRYLDSMLYQGGLPMKLVTGSHTNTAWDRFARGLVNKRIDFDELQLGVVASNCQCLRTFCGQLILGIESEKHELMPFFCENENNSWYQSIQALRTEEIKRRRVLNPLKLSFEFDIDNVEKKLSIKYVFSGVRKFADAFLQEHELDKLKFFLLQVRKNGQAVDTFEYTRNYCRHTVESRHPYHYGDSISVFLHDKNISGLNNEELDMDVPHLLYREMNGKYADGNRLGVDESFLLIPDGWEIQNDALLECVREYTWGNRALRGLRIDDDYTEDIIVKCGDEFIVFGMNKPLYWTEMHSSSQPLPLPAIVEPIYDASKCSFDLCCDKEGYAPRHTQRLQYRNKWQREWSDKPSYGEIFVRAIDDKGNYVTKLSFINVGEGITITQRQADRDSCMLKVEWKYGNVSTTEGEKQDDGFWKIEKRNCADPRHIRFQFTPHENGNNYFYLSIKAPFKDFSIIDINKENVQNGALVPYIDVDRYNYHIVGQNIEYTYAKNNIKRKLVWNDGQLRIREYTTDDWKSLKTVPYVGSLATLFDSREVLRSLLDRTSKNLTEAEIKVQFTFDNGKSFSIIIKECPFELRQEGDCVKVKNGNFTGDLQLIKLSDPLHEAVSISFNQEKGSYILPEEVKHWEKAIATGCTKGRILPKLVNFNEDLTDEKRKKNREAVIACISEELRNSTIGDKVWRQIMDWFERAQQECIPASSILELFCTANNHDSLLCLTFLLYTKCKYDDDRDLLKDKLKSFSNDLAFQWYWLQPYIHCVAIVLNRFIGSYPFSETEYRDIIECIEPFISWMEELCISSLLEQYDDNTATDVEDCARRIITQPDNLTAIAINDRSDQYKYIDVNQGKEILTKTVKNFFLKYNEENKTPNEQWLYQRVNAVVAHLKKEIDFFNLDLTNIICEEDEDTPKSKMQEEIRRSIIFCSKSCNNYFVIVLNNKLAKK